MIPNTYWKSVRYPDVDHGKLGLAIECRMAFSCKELRHMMKYYIIVLLLPKICLPKINLSGFSPLTYPVIMNDIISWYLDVCFCSGIDLQECAHLSRKNFSASISLKKIQWRIKGGETSCVHAFVGVASFFGGTVSYLVLCLWTDHGNGLWLEPPVWELLASGCRELLVDLFHVHILFDDCVNQVLP